MLGYLHSAHKPTPACCPYLRATKLSALSRVLPRRKAHRSTSFRENSTQLHKFTSSVDGCGSSIMTSGGTGAIAIHAQLCYHPETKPHTSEASPPSLAVVADVLFTMMTTKPQRFAREFSRTVFFAARSPCAQTQWQTTTNKSLRIERRGG